LVITGGSEELTNDLLEWVKRGNTINGIDNPRESDGKYLT